MPCGGGGRRLTDGSYDLRLHDVLRTEPGHDELPIRSLILRPPDLVPHVSTRKDQDGHQAQPLPDYLGLDQGDDVGGSKVESDGAPDDGEGDGDVRHWVEGDVDGEWFGSEFGYPAVEAFDGEAAREGSGISLG